MAKFAPQNFFKSHFMRVAVVVQESAITIIKEKAVKIIHTNVVQNVRFHVAASRFSWSFENRN